MNASPVILPVDPVCFSGATLDAVEKASPSHLASPVGTPVPHGKHVIFFKLHLLEAFQMFVICPDTEQVNNSEDCYMLLNTI